MAPSSRAALLATRSARRRAIRSLGDQKIPLTCMTSRGEGVLSASLSFLHFFSFYECGIQSCHVTPRLLSLLRVRKFVNFASTCSVLLLPLTVTQQEEQIKRLHDHITSEIKERESLIKELKSQIDKNKKMLEDLKPRN